ncbi:hypothetical protein U1Q18_016266 [Sarracenia purpurea var. burkii]
MPLKEDQQADAEAETATQEQHLVVLEAEAQLEAPEARDAAHAKSKANHGRRKPQRFVEISSQEMGIAKRSYEDLRRQRLEENKKRMEELHLPQLSQAFKQQSSPKPSPVKRATPRVIRTELVAVRRSNRVANKPAPSYREIVIYERSEAPRRNLTGIYKRDLSNRVYASDEDRAMAISRAEELESGLEADYPTFVKPMTQSHVTGGFWLGLPAYFCRRNLPRRDETVTLVDEEGEEFPTVYLARKAGLSGGWRGFSIDHGLVDGDALVFQLIRPTVFKVYIIRVNSLTDGDNLKVLDV